MKLLLMASAYFWSTEVPPLPLHAEASAGALSLQLNQLWCRIEKTAPSVTLSFKQKFLRGTSLF